MTSDSLDTRLRVGRVVAAVVVTAAVSGLVGASDAASTRFAPQTGVCPRPALQPGDLRLASAGNLSADVDGDGRPDRVYVLLHRHSAQSCRFLLVARSKSRAYVGYLRQAGADHEWPNRDAPVLDVAAPIDAVGGEEVVVAVAAGASTTSVGVYSVRDGFLVRLRVSKAAFEPNTFAYGGSLPSSFSVDCIPGRRRLVAETGFMNNPNGLTVKVDRSLYRATNLTFRLVGHRVYAHLTLREARKRFPELRPRGRIFTACR
jgi:hypothetical protein